MKSPKPYSVGRVVMYVPTDDDNAYAAGNDIALLPACIVRTWEHTSYENDEVNLKVFSDGPVDLWRTSVPYSENKEPGTWHWSEIAEVSKTFNINIETMQKIVAGDNPSDARELAKQGREAVEEMLKSLNNAQ